MYVCVYLRNNSVDTVIVIQVIMAVRDCPDAVAVRRIAIRGRTSPNEHFIIPGRRRGFRLVFFLFSRRGYDYWRDRERLPAGAVILFDAIKLDL